MKIDFSDINKKLSKENIIAPDEIYRILPDNGEKHEYLRDVQGRVLAKWFDESVRNNKDTVIKMNTGSGKTVVGLLILQSCIEEGKGPAVYVVPDKYLVNQVIEEAERIGIKTTTDEDDLSYRRSKAILVINISKLINGLSVFGMRPNMNNVPIGSIIIDDVHAALATTEKQFRITIPRSNDLYDKFLNMFESSLKHQSQTQFLEIEDGCGYHEMLVPYWEWQNREEDIIKLLHKSREDEDIKFNWMLLKDVILYSKCIITKDEIEISPNSIPIDKIINFHNAKRRIFMSATLANDTAFATHFGVNFDKAKIITPDTASDIGERLIIVPNAMNPNISDEEIRERVKEIAKKRNVVVIVPSGYQAKLWKRPKRVIDSNNIDKAVEALKNKHVGLMIFKNRYDGIDLPHKACELLVIDGLPRIHSKYDAVEVNSLLESKRIQSQLIQRIEQGMGRGVRSNNDYCAIILMNKSLVSTLYADEAIDDFSAATKKQFELSQLVTDSVQSPSIDDIFILLDFSFNRNSEWVNANKVNLVKVKYKSQPNLNDQQLISKKAFELMRLGRNDEAIKLINDYTNQIKDNDRLKGWLMQQIAEYQNISNIVESQNILKAAKKINPLLLKPIDGIQTSRELKKFSNQAEQFIKNMHAMKLNMNKYILKVNAIVDQLAFAPENSNRFEEALKQLAYLIGFEASRPENEEGKGPDDLWRVGDLDFLVIECKSEATNPLINKHDCNQLNGSINWFETEYKDKACSYLPILIHIGDTFEYAAPPNESIRIMNEAKLNKLKNNVVEFSRALSEVGFENIPKITELFKAYKLTSSHIKDTYTIDFRVKK